MRTLYLFVNNYGMPQWLDCLSLTDDGYILGNHICSAMNFMVHDLHDREDRLEKIKAHFKDEEYKIELLSYEQCKTHTDFLAALQLAEKRNQEVDKAGVTLELTNE